MTDLQKNKWAKQAWIIGSFLLILALSMSPIVHVYDSFEGGDSGFMVMLICLFRLLNMNLSVELLYGIATISALITIYHFIGSGFLGQKSLPLLPIVAIVLGLAFMPLVSTIEPTPNSNEIAVRLGWDGYLVWMLSLVCILIGSLLQRNINYKETNMETSNVSCEIPVQRKQRTFVALVLGGDPSIFQKIFFWLMLLSCFWWPLGVLMSAFLFDAPINNFVDGLGRYGLVLNIFAYPATIIFMMRFLFQLSNRKGQYWIFYLTPLVPVALFLFFGSLVFYK